MYVRKELGYLPDDPYEMEFVYSVLQKSQKEDKNDVDKDTKNAKLKGLINKNK